MKNSIQQLVGETDIYLIDQIMKGRYKPDDKILDAGCGNGRNMQWFLQNNYSIFGFDKNEEIISQLKNKHLEAAERFTVSTVEETKFTDNFFDHIICSAVLHFASSTVHFEKMLSELVRILKPKGSLFIRMTSDIGIEDSVHPISDGVYLIPDGSKRFLLNRSLIEKSLRQNNLSFIEPLKTVNVNDERCMSTLILQKNRV